VTDDELAAYLGISPEHPKKVAVIAGLGADKRAVFERMAALEVEVELWQAGLAPKPTNVLLDMERDVKRY
jgi:hypothetical protein